MRILILNHNYSHQATWFRAWNVAKVLHAAGAEVYFFCLNQTKHKSLEFMEEGIHVIQTPFSFFDRYAPSGHDPRDICFRIRHVLKMEWDVLYAFGALPSITFPFRFAQKKYPNRTFLADWDDLYSDGGMNSGLDRFPTRWLHRAECGLEQYMVTASEFLTVTSRLLEDKALAWRQDKQVAYVPAGADYNKIPVVDQVVARKELGFPTDKIIVTYLASSVVDLDALHILEAFRLAHSKNPNLYLAYIGYREEDREVIKNNGLEQAIRLVPKIPFEQVKNYLGLADMLAMPLVPEWMNNCARGPIKLKDYLCAGRPMVATNVGEAATLLAEHPVGIPVESTPEGFAEGILKLAEDEALREKMGMLARQTAEQVFPWKNVCKPVLTYLKLI